DRWGRSISAGRSEPCGASCVGGRVSEYGRSYDQHRVGRFGRGDRLMGPYEQGRFLGAGDADRGGLAGRTVAVLGYGNLGRSMALNLRDAGVEVVVGNIADEYRRLAEQDGFGVLGLAEASASAELVYLLLPDEVIPEVFAG